MVDRIFGRKDRDETEHTHGGRPHSHAGGDDPHTHDEELTTTRETVGGVSAREESGRTVELREEELQARTRPVEAGEVRIGKEVVTEQRTMEVPVTREEVEIERRPVDRQPSDRPIGEGETISVPVREEQVTVEKRPVVTEEIRVGKQEVQDTEQVSGTVRREEARIEREGDVTTEGGDATRDRTVR